MSRDRRFQNQSFTSQDQQNQNSRSSKHHERLRGGQNPAPGRYEKTTRENESHESSSRTVETHESGPLPPAEDNAGEGAGAGNDAPNSGDDSGRSSDRGDGSGTANNWYQLVPQQVRVAVDGVRPAGDSRAEMLSGDYILELEQRSPLQCQWGLALPECCGLDRVELIAAPDGDGLDLHVFFSGSAPGPAWSGRAPQIDSRLLSFDSAAASNPAAGALWPEVVLVSALGAAQQPVYISTEPTAAELAAIGGAGSGSSSCSCSCSCSSSCSSSGECLPCPCEEEEPCDDDECDCPPEDGEGGGSSGGGGGCFGGTCPISGSSEFPVRYFSGELQLSVADVSASGFGSPWQHERVYSHRMSSDYDYGNGFNWIVRQWGYLLEAPSGRITIVRGPGQNLWFDAGGDGGYRGRHGTKATLVHDAASGLFLLKTPSGQQHEFHDFDQLSYPPGQFARHKSAGGQVTEVTSYTLDDQIAEIQRSVTADGSTTTESFLYDYFTSGDQEGRLQYVTLRRKTDSDPWQEIQRTEYDYYAAGEDHGSLGDLRRAKQQEPDGAGGWQDKNVHYYRYWKAGDSLGFAHGLKYVLEPESYARLAEVSDPLSASDSQVAQYADYYYEYTSGRRVSKETVQAGALSYTFFYSTSGNSRDYNHWRRKTVEIRPDGAEHLVYTNHAGQVLVKELKSGSDRWIEYRKYDSAGRLIEHAEPSAVIDYDDTYADLNVSLETSEGLIRSTEYYSTTGSGAAEGYKKAEKVQQGSEGTPVVLRELEYASHTDDGRTVHPVSKQTVYRNDDGTGAVETSYSYSFHSGTVQMEERTTTLPPVPSAQNGSGTSDTRTERFDIRGQLTWLMDERGFITRQKYDSVTGALTQRIEDVDTDQTAGEPSGWSTPSGGGLHLVSDFEHDDRGRITQQLGPEHTLDIGGVATSVRRATWIVYKDVDHQQWTGQGYRDVSAASDTLINPVAIIKRDRKGHVLEEIQAVRSSTSGKLTSSDSFSQSDYVRWTTHQYTDCCTLVSRREYHTIPASGEGSSGTNYDETQFGYDSMKRRNRTVSLGGTIRFDVFDVRDQVVETYIGTDDSGATESDPTGGGTSDNNMVLVSALEYDHGTDGGDGNLTQQTQYVDGLTSRMTSYQYDWRNRRTDIDGEVDFYERRYHDNLDRMTKTERYDTTDTGNLVSRSEAKFDDRGRQYQQIRHEVDPSTGSVGNSLTDNVWFDAAGNPIKELSAGLDLFTKRVYDGAGRMTAQYVGYDLDENSYSEADSLSGDTILEQSETDYDDANNVIQTTARQRYHSAAASETGALGDPATSPKARVSYSASWHDALGRQIASADYGTNGGSSLSRPSTVPSRSDTVLVNSTEYNNDGEAFKRVDPAGKEDRTEFDDAGRKTKEIENYVDGDPSTGTSDEDVTVEMSYHADGQLETLTAKNSDTGDQVTTYVYGTTLTDSDIARSDLLRAEIYPESDDVADPLGDGPDGIYDRIEYQYNRQGQKTQVKDQRETVHAYEYDKLGRQTQDRITSLGSGVDGAVRRIATTYEVRGMTESVTSYDSATVGSGTIVNDVEMVYNGFGQLVTEYQQHDGAVNTSTTPKVQYGYADGSDNHIRPASITYPSGRSVDYDYGSAGSMDNAASRVQAIKDGTIALVEYSYLGRGMAVEVDYTEPDIKYTLVDLAGSDDADTGDIYSGLDRFGRVKDSRWYDYGASTDADRIQYGYDRAGNRAYREVVLDPNDVHDELYAHDGAHRLSDFDRGALNSAKDAINTLKFAQQWSLDPTGNWSGFQEDSDGDGSWDLDQSRSHNPVNEITGVTESAGSSWATPGYDRAGNMTSLPQPADPTETYSGTWDGWNRLVKLVDDATSSTLQENEYDGRKFRIVRKDYSGGVLDETRHFYYTDQWQSIEERVGSSTDPDRQFVWGRRYIDDLVLRDRDTTGSGTLDERHYAMQDGNWNVTAVADDGGTVAERYAYAAYGEVKYLDASYSEVAGSNYAWGYLYTGRYLDVTSGLYYFRHRMLDPKLGRFCSRDPIGYEGSPWNLYRFMACKPINEVDPKGLSITSDNMGAYIACECAWECNGWLLDIWGWVRDDAVEKAGDTADEHYPDDPERHRVLRHCVANAVMASEVGCKCTQCVGTARERWQNEHGQDPRRGQQGIFNNAIGLRCAGCRSTDGSMSPFPGPVREEPAVQCCIDAVAEGHGDILEGDPTMPEIID